MLRPLAGVMILAVLGGSLPAEEKTDRPQGPQPVQVVVKVEKGQLVIPQVVPAFRTEKRTRTVKKDGEERPETYTVEVPDFRVRLLRIDLKEIQAFDTDGKKIEPTKLAELLRKETHVLVSADGKKVDPFYLQIIKEGTPVLILPRPKEPERVAPPPRRQPRRERDGDR